ncbi:MAG TPA: DUF4272 domain-containing protein [Pyrinomonadaceae bacterium]|nr:DUF4272 domain-containing protein [Pyrinomonadaceae bacterium]
MTELISKEQLERKKRSEQQLQTEGVPFIEHLPVIEGPPTAQLRSVEDVAWRAMCLNLVAVKGEGMGYERLTEIIEQYGLREKFTRDEVAFIESAEPTDHERNQFTWRYEAYWVLLWGLSYIPELGRPDQICDVPRSVKIMVDRTAEEFIHQSRLRDIEQILDAADLIYRYHWACRDANLVGNPPPAGLNGGVVLERHYALNWLIGYPESDTDWDDISTDT